MHSSVMRPAGVVTPIGQRSGENEDASDLPSLSLHNFDKLEMFAGRFVNKKGKLEPAFFIKFGDSFYLDPNGPHWFGSLKPLSKELHVSVRQQYEKIAKVIPDDIPMEDAVDVVAGFVVGKGDAEDGI